MLSLAASEKSNVFPVRKRRRLGAWLLVGWLAYWFTTVAQACCVGLAADPGSVGRTPAFHASEAAIDASGSPTLPALPDLDCDALSAIGPGAAATATPTLGHLDPWTMPSLASQRFATDDHIRFLPASDPSHPPASGVPLFLRNKRFLI